MSARHTPATSRIQRRLERWELEHLRAHAADLAERVERLEWEVSNADAAADMWRDSHHRLSEHLDDGTADARCMGLTRQGELLVVRTERRGMSPAIRSVCFAGMFAQPRGVWRPACVTRIYTSPSLTAKERRA